MKWNPDESAGCSWYYPESKQGPREESDVYDGDQPKQGDNRAKDLEIATNVASDGSKVVWLGFHMCGRGLGIRHPHGGGTEPTVYDVLAPAVYSASLSLLICYPAGLNHSHTDVAELQ